MPKYSEEMDRTVSWPLLPDELTIKQLVTIREEKKCNDAMGYVGSTRPC